MPLTNSGKNFFALLAKLDIHDQDDDANVDEAMPFNADDGAFPNTPLPAAAPRRSSSTAANTGALVPGVTRAEGRINDDHRPEDDEFVVLDSDEEDSDLDLEVIHATFDLLALEEKSTYKPIFTRGLLQRIASDTTYILSEQSKPVAERGAGLLQYQQPNGQSVKIWKAVDNADSITVHYMTRVEMCPGFWKQFGAVSNRGKLLHGLNSRMTEQGLNEIETPYFFVSYLRAPDTTPYNFTLMDRWRAKLGRTQQLWSSSNSCTQLRKIIQLGASKIKTPVTKIVCVGLGKLNSDPSWYQSSLQHMTVFSIAKTLDAFNRAKDPNCPPVKMIAQDPCYEACDRILLQELTSTSIEFGLTDPETLLAIDANTLVVSAFLPTSVPLVQIVADLFDDRRDEGPAMMLCDKMPELREEKRWFCMRNRSSPAVARILSGGYLPWKNGFENLEEALREDVSSNVNNWVYWLDEMDLWLRKDT